MNRNSYMSFVPVQTNIKELRIAANLTQAEASERFGCSLRLWQLKEAKDTKSLFSQAEYELLLLLADKHPYYKLNSR
ncbi:helix-turn-helix domain-containing protein [Pantoea stewartii]|uniref:helix-turn-helix domain-containing protein n=1 Tax=Pantoea stewartii TaxID=66269 RepID=UPI001CF79F60|nr:helix-turn-helix transcriptional regulator [Pantoea stewartii]